MELGDEVVRLRERLDVLYRDFGLALQSFTSLHTNIEADLDKLEKQVEGLRDDGHALDKRVTVMEHQKPSDVTTLVAQVNELAQKLAVISAMLEEAKNGRYDITGAFRTHRGADGASDPQPPAREEHEGTDWAAVVRDASTKWGPALAAVAALILALLQQCGVVAPPPPTPPRTEQTAPTHNEEPH